MCCVLGLCQVSVGMVVMGQRWWLGLLVAFGASCALMGCVKDNALFEPEPGACPDGTTEEGGRCVAPNQIRVGPGFVGPAREGANFEALFEAVGGKAPYSFSTEGVLPLGLEMSADGMLSGNPQSAGTFEFEVIAEDDEGLRGVVALSLEVIAGQCSPETCDGVDNDCDGQTDEGVTNACGTCGPAPDEVCDGQDNDCDGEVDEGVLNACGQCGPVPEEVCDGEDNDCDGQIDEGACGEGLNLRILDAEVEQPDTDSREVLIAYEVVNDGPEESVAFVDAIFLTRPETTNVVEAVLDVVEQEPLAPGDDQFVELEVEIPEEFQSGSWAVVIVIDQRGETGDVDGADNVARLPCFFLAPSDEECELGPGASCAGADLSEEVLRNAQLAGADLAGADLRRADLTGADLTGANLEGAILRASSLRDANLTGADLQGADLRGANLREVDLTGANLRGANLDGANLRGANLTDADLTDASMVNTGLRDVIWLVTTCPDGSISDNNGGTCEGNL